MVTLGSPHQQRRGAEAGARTPRARVLGKSVLDVVAGAPRAWPLPARARSAPSAANAPIGIGRGCCRYRNRTTARSPSPTATAPKRHWPWRSAQLVLPVTHTGLLTSGRVAEAVVTRFLRQGTSVTRGLGRVFTR